MSLLRIAAVVRLLLPSGPSAVPRRVGAIVIDSIYRQVRRWARAHVGVKTREIVAPLIAHADSASTVAEKIRVSGIAASLFRSLPDVPFGRLTQPMRETTTAHDLGITTAAASRNSTHHTVSVDFFQRAAIASAQKVSHPIWAAGDFMQQRPPMKAQSIQTAGAFAWFHMGSAT